MEGDEVPYADATPDEAFDLGYEKGFDAAFSEWEHLAVLEAELQTTKDALAEVEEQRTKLAEKLAAIEHFGSYQPITADQDKVVEMPICDVCKRPIKWSFDAKKWVHNPPLTRAEWHQPSNADPFSGVTP